MKVLAPTDEKYFYSRGRPSDVRLGDIFFRLTAKSIDDFKEVASLEQMKGHTTLVLSYVDEKKTNVEGVKFSSRKSPQRIKNSLFQLTPPFFIEEKLSFVDCGALVLDASLAEYQTSNRELIYEGVVTGHRWLTLGGSQLRLHAEVDGWQRGAAVLSKKRPLLIHFTSGLSMSPADELNLESLHFHLSQNSAVDLLVVGSHPGFFSREYFKAFTNLPNCRLVFLEELCNTTSSAFDILLQTAEDWMTTRRPTWISIDIGVLGSSYSGNYPLARPLGIPAGELIKTLSTLYHRHDVQGLGIFNVDADHSPAVELASEVAYRYLYSL